MAGVGYLQKEELPNLIEQNLLYFGVKGDAKPSIKQFFNEGEAGPNANDVVAIH